MIALAVALIAVATLGLCIEAGRDFHREGIARVRRAQARERASRPVPPGLASRLGPVNRRERSWS